VLKYEGNTLVKEVTCDENPASPVSFLLQSLKGLYPDLEATNGQGNFILEGNKLEQLNQYDLLYITDQQIQALSTTELEILQAYLAAGGVLLVDGAKNYADLEQLTKIQQALQQSITFSAQNPDLLPYQQKLKEEFTSLTTTIQSKITKLAEFYNQKFNTRLQNLEQILDHPLRKEPFFFSALPTPILTQGGVVVLAGQLTETWGIQQNKLLSRETIRTAQEMGINILHFAWRRRQLMQLQNLEKVSLPPSSPSPNTPIAAPPSPAIPPQLEKRKRPKPSDNL
jgi:Domain of unknown function (DUF4159)